MSISHSGQATGNTLTVINVVPFNVTKITFKNYPNGPGPSGRLKFREWLAYLYLSLLACLSK